MVIVLAALMVADSAWGQTARGTLPDPNELNEDLSTGIYTLTKNYKPGSQKRWRVSGGRNVIVDLNGYTIDGVNIDRTIFNISSGTLTIIDSKGGGTIKNSTKSCFYVAPSSGAKSTLNFQGGTILNCQPSDGNGGAMDIQPNGTVNMSGGTITGCKGTSGAAVYVIGGTFNMTGGTITNNKVNAYKDWTPPTGTEALPTSNNTSTTRGGGIYVEKGKCTVSGGTISGNVAHSGGGVFVTSGATFSFTGGTIEGNYAVAKLGQGTGNGGGIYIEGGNSNCTINGGTIRNNRATRYGGGININGSTMTIPNCTISGNLASSGGGISMETSGSTLNLQGCTLKGNIAKISTSDPNGSGKGGGGGIFLVDGTLKMSGTNSIQTNHSYELGGGVYLKKGTVNIEGGTSTFTKNDAETSGGAIYLAAGNITVAAGATLTVGSSSSNGNTATTNGGGIYCNGTITVNGTTNIKYNSATDGGGIYCQKAISLKGTSTIAYNSATNKGGGIYCAAQVDVTGQSQMSHNSATDGGAAYVTGNNLNLAKCTAESNSSTHYGGAFYVVGGNITFSDAATISSNTAIERGGAAYVENGTISTASGDIKTILSNNTVIGIENGTEKYSGGAFYLKGATDKPATLYLKGKTEMTSNSAVNNGGAIALNQGNVMITGAETIFSSNTANRGGAIYVSEGNFATNNTSTVTSLTHNNCTDNGGAVYVTGGNFTTEGSITITDNYATDNGGAVYVTGGQVTMAAPTITGNGKNSGTAVTKNGGAIYVTGDGASFTTSGTCTISSNAAKTSGGAVYVNGGTLTTGSTATIEDNYASSNGGAFYVTGGSVNMNKANINRNGKIGSTTVATNGGAIYVTGDGAGFVATGTAKFNSNAAKSNGGAIYVSGGSLTLASNATIDNNSATHGGAFHVTNGNISTSTGSISNNTADLEEGDGGAFYVNQGTVTLGKVDMASNKAFNGGAIALYNGTFSLDNESQIKENTATYGGGLYVKNTASHKKISCEGGTFLKNTAQLGGGIYASGDIELTFAANVEENLALNGGGLYLDDGIYMKFGNGLIVKNEAKEAETATRNSSTSGVGGGIYLAKGRLSFTERANLGIYNNVAAIEAADIYSSGSDATVELPYVKGMNLTGFDVPGSELYWVRDFSEQRYEAALRDLNINIEDLIEPFTDAEISETYKTITSEICLDLGYDLVFVTLSSFGLVNNDNAAINIAYQKPGITDPVVYRKVLFTGEESKIVGLPSGDWQFEVTEWSKKYKDPTIDPGIGANGFLNIKRNHNQNIRITFEKKHESHKAVTFDAKLLNKMYPGGAPANQ